MVLARLKAATTGLINKGQDWSQKLLENVFPQNRKKPTAKLTNETVEQIDNAMEAKPGSNFFKQAQWQKAQVVDLTETDKLPEAYEVPKKAKLVKVAHGTIDNPESIINDAKFRNNIPKQGLVVREVITKKQILNLLQNDPSKLTDEMAKVLTGDKEGIKGLNPREMAAALQRMEMKFQGDERRMPSAEVRSRLINHVINNGSESLTNEVTSYKGIHKGTGLEGLVRNDERSQADKTQQAIEQIHRKTKKNLEKAEINTSGDLVEKMYAAAKKSIIENANASKRTSLSGKDKKNILIRNFQSVRADIAKDKLADFDKAALKMVHELETMYENGGNRLSRSYSRITKLNSGLSLDSKNDTKREVKLAQKKINRATKIENNYSFKESVVRGIESLPYSFLAKIVDSGKRLNIAQSMQAFGKEGRIEGDLLGRNFENTAGLCDENGNAILTKEFVNRKNYSVEKLKPQDAMATARHELGHVLLRVLQADSPKAIQALEKAYKKDLEELKQKPQNIQDAMAYQVQENPGKPGQATAKGFSEAFAYSFANKYGGDKHTQAFRFQNLEKMISKLEKHLDEKTARVGDEGQLAQRIIKDHSLVAQVAA
jgi:hypothetical protein